MTLSIIIPLYNVELYIEECIKSIYAQKYNFEFEVIVIDDESKDKSFEILDHLIKEHRYSNISVIKHPKNKGLGAARNTGIENAKGQYIWFIDSDDTINADSLVNLNLENAKEDIIVFGVNETDESLNFKKEYVRYDEKLINCLSESYKGDFFLQLEVVAWNKVIRRDLFQHNLDLRFDERVINEDEVFSLLLTSKAKNVKWSGLQIYNYRIRENSITTSKISNNFFTSWEIIFEQAHHFFENYSDNHFINWMLAKISVFFRKYKFTEEQLIQLKLIFAKFYSIYPEQCWKESTYFSNCELFLSNIYDIYKKKSTAEKPKVSVVIPTYKRPETAVNAIQSVIDQSYSNIEIIVVNDSGSDPEYEKKYETTLAPYMDKIIYYKAEVNLGGGKARNKGIELAQGDYISFLDDDDFYKKDRISNAVVKISQYDHPLIWGVYCGYESQHTNSINTSDPDGDLSYYILMLQYEEFSLHTNTSLIKKSFLDSHQVFFDPELRRNQDLDFYLKMFNHGYCIGYKEVDVIMRPEEVTIENYLNNEKMHFTKRAFLTKNQKSIEKFHRNIQKQIYFENWNNVLHYYLTDNKISSFEKYMFETNDLASTHEMQFVLEKRIEDSNFEPLSVGTSPSNGSSNTQDHYNKVYENMPLWWKKLGALIRKIYRK